MHYISKKCIIHDYFTMTIFIRMASKKYILLHRLRDVYTFSDMSISDFGSI